MSRLVVISNRVASDPTGKPSAGGLAVAVNAALRSEEGLWFGWSGKTTEEPPDEPEILENGRISYAVTDLTKRDLDEYYSGFANRVLWPILHYRIDLAEFSRQELRAYQRVNQFFADRLTKLLRPDDVIWVHDYHLMPLARMLRQKGFTNRIGFFLHIPFPPADLMTVLPRHQEVVGPLLDYDLVGFQTTKDANHFAHYLTTEIGAASPDGRTFRRPNGGSMVVAVFPVGIEVDAFRRAAEKAEGTVFLKSFRSRLVDRHILIGVDRLDYSKGIPQRLEAFEHFLATHPEWHGRTSFLQITPKSRATIPEYAMMAETVSAHAGRINGRLGEADWMPVRYVNRSHTRGELAGLYRASRVGLVTPLRDGMNLVAKEYVACQDPEQPGVLVLSQFAGAAAELEAALLVNPYDREAVASAIERALSMPLEERIERHHTMMRGLRHSDIGGWARRFLDELTRPSWNESQPPPSSSEAGSTISAE